MALVPATLQAQLLTVFVPTMTDDTFSSSLASMINAYCATGLIAATPVAGTVSGGTFSGAAQGTVTVNVSSSDIKDVCDAMKSNPSYDEDKEEWDPGLGEDDAYLAKQLATLIDDAVTNGTFNVTISGTITAPNGATSSGTDSATITWTGQPSVIENALVGCFTSSMTDALFAQTLATAVTSYLTSATIKVEGTMALAGAQGMGSMS